MATVEAEPRCTACGERSGDHYMHEVGPEGTRPAAPGWYGLYCGAPASKAFSDTATTSLADRAASDPIGADTAL